MRAARKMQPAPDATADVAEGDGLQQRLRACARWIELLADEVAAIEAADPARLCEIAMQRRRLEVELYGPDDADQAPAGVAAAIEQGIGRVEGRSGEEQRSRDWVAALQDASLPMLRHLSLPRRVPGRYSWSGTWDARVNVRL